MSDREHQVRECAYYFWEAEGRPEGRAQMHWSMAEIATTLFSYLNAANKPPAPDTVESVTKGDPFVAGHGADQCHRRRDDG